MLPLTPVQIYCSMSNYPKNGHSNPDHPPVKTTTNLYCVVQHRPLTLCSLYLEEFESVTLSLDLEVQLKVWPNKLLDLH